MHTFLTAWFCLTFEAASTHFPHNRLAANKRSPNSSPHGFHNQSPKWVCLLWCCSVGVGQSEYVGSGEHGFYGMQRPWQGTWPRAQHGLRHSNRGMSGVPRCVHSSKNIWMPSIQSSDRSAVHMNIVDADCGPSAYEPHTIYPYFIQRFKPGTVEWMANT